MSFSDHLDNHLGQSDLEAQGDPDVYRETSPDDARPDAPHTELSGPDPHTVAGAQVVHMFETVSGNRIIPDMVDKAAVEAAILKLTPADIRDEMLLNVRDAAQFLGINETTLRAWRDRQINLRYYAAPAAGKFNHRRIFYRVADLIRYREFVYTRVSPTDVRMPTPGMMGTPSAPGVFAPPTPPQE